MTRLNPARTDDQNSTALVNKTTPPGLMRELSDDEIAAVIGGFSHVQLPIIVKGSHIPMGRHGDGRPIESMPLVRDHRFF
jgi:hypothetical protein